MKLKVQYPQIVYLEHSHACFCVLTMAASVLQRQFVWLWLIIWPINAKIHTLWPVWKSLMTCLNALG